MRETNAGSLVRDLREKRRHVPSGKLRVLMLRAVAGLGQHDQLRARDAPNERIPVGGRHARVVVAAEEGLELLLPGRDFRHDVRARVDPFV